MTMAELLIVVGQVFCSGLTLSNAASTRTRVPRLNAWLTTAALGLVAAGMLFQELYWATGMVGISVLGWAFMAIRRAA